MDTKIIKEFSGVASFFDDDSEQFFKGSSTSRLQKLKFLQISVTYLEQTIDASGLSKTLENLEAIMEVYSLWKTVSN